MQLQQAKTPSPSSSISPPQKTSKRIQHVADPLAQTQCTTAYNRYSKLDIILAHLANWIHLHVKTRHRPASWTLNPWSLFTSTVLQRPKTDLDYPCVYNIIPNCWPGSMAKFVIRTSLYFFITPVIAVCPLSLHCKTNKKNMNTTKPKAWTQNLILSTHAHQVWVNWTELLKTIALW